MNQRTVFSSIIIVFELRNIKFLKDFPVNPIHVFILRELYAIQFISMEFEHHISVILI